MVTVNDSLKKTLENLAEPPDWAKKIRAQRGDGRLMVWDPDLNEWWQVQERVNVMDRPEIKEYLVLVNTYGGSIGAEWGPFRHLPDAEGCVMQLIARPDVYSARIVEQQKEEGKIINRKS